METKLVKNPIVPNLSLSTLKSHIKGELGIVGMAGNFLKTY